MRNIPKKIYLQIGGSDVTIDKSITDWNDLFQGAITWADHRINDNDIEFVLSDVSKQRELLIAFLEMNNWLSLEDEQNAKGVVEQSEQLFKLRDNCVNGVDDEVCMNSGICKYCS